MKVLWFTNTPSLYKAENKGYNGGGWISSLQLELLKLDEVDLGIGFLHSDSVFKVKQGNTTYYPIALYKSKFQKVRHNLFYERFDNVEVDAYLKIVNDFKPDIIHVFGTEQSFGLLSSLVDMPVVIHIQGMLGPYLNAYFPPGCSVIDYFRYLKLSQVFGSLKSILSFSRNAKREERILKGCKNVMGRTEWDFNVTRLYAKDSRYFYCSELLRGEFYDASPWKFIKNPDDVITIVSTISRVDYKGYDLILKTALLLKKHTNRAICWKVFGISEFSFWDKKLRIVPSDVDVRLMGVASPEQLLAEMQHASIFVHPSYIDNSPNSLCEAQLIGMPVISTNVGGIPSLIEHNITGFLIPSNDPYTLATKIISVYDDVLLAETVGVNARYAAIERHDVSKVVNTNIEIYKALLDKF
jgi:glycosyltransferase involved in cell wall biosynthesis